MVTSVKIGCRHCNRKGFLRTNQLCIRCNANPAIRAKYMAKPKTPRLAVVRAAFEEKHDPLAHVRRKWFGPIEGDEDDDDEDE